MRTTITTLGRGQEPITLADPTRRRHQRVSRERSENPRIARTTETAGVVPFVLASFATTFEELSRR